jgi:predicted RNA-binding Zn-ribbon protein involved in translation (DUF1610 family)
MKTPRNILVQYQGGGYDGCHWEWNFFFFDGRGKFHNLFSSGNYGIKTKEEALKVIKEKKNAFFSSFYKYNLTNKKHIKEFMKENAEMNIIEIGGAVNDITAKNTNKFMFECPDCGHKIVLSKKEHNQYPQVISTGYRGNGGVGLVFTNHICEDCYCNGLCADCGEYDTELNQNGLCGYCSEKEVA